MGSYKNVIITKEGVKGMLVKGIIIVVALVIMIGVLLFTRAKQMERENRIIESYMKASERFFAEISKRVEATRHYRHDLSNYIQMLDTLLEKEERSEMIQEYMDEQKTTYAKLSKQKLCQDEFINTMIQMKKEECQEKGIVFHVEVDNADYSGMEEMDKVCLFMNLLDNAVEATEKIQIEENREIFLKVEKQEDELIVRIQNPLEPNKSFSFLTTKPDKENHGIGTAIITKIIKKYNGERKVEIDEEKGVLNDCVICRMNNEVVA